MKDDLRRLEDRVSALEKGSSQELRRLRNQNRNLQAEKEALMAVLLRKAFVTEEEVKAEEEARKDRGRVLRVVERAEAGTGSQPEGNPDSEGDRSE
jgi:hypothetical protein